MIVTTSSKKTHPLYLHAKTLVLLVTLFTPILFHQRNQNNLWQWIGTHNEVTRNQNQTHSNALSLSQTHARAHTHTHVAYRMLEEVLEMTSFNSQTCLTPGEQIIKYCLKFCSKKLPTCAASLMAAACFNHSHSYRRASGALYHICHRVKLIPLSVKYMSSTA
jgi:hypothetical protein